MAQILDEQGAALLDEDMVLLDELGDPLLDETTSSSNFLLADSTQPLLDEQTHALEGASWRGAWRGSLRGMA
jgi:hypothetical protein